MGRASPSWGRLALALLALLVGRGAIAAPRIVALFPAGGQRGTTVRVTLSGEGLKDLKGFFALGTGLKAKLLPGGDNATRTAEIAVAPDAPTGIQAVRFFDDTGLSNPRYFQVGTLPETWETEPNDEIASAPKVTLPITVNGRIAANPDRDGVTFHARAGETVVCEIQGLRVLGQVGDSWLKGFLEIVDARGRTLASSEGTSDDYYRWDPLILFTPKEEGDYTAFFRDLNWRGDIRSVYRLTLGAVPHATGIWPLGGKRGSAIPMSAGGAYLAGAIPPLTIPADAPETLTIAPGGALNARPFQTSDLPDVNQMDASRVRDPGQRVPFPCVVNGQFSERATDFYRFVITEKATVALEVFSRRLGTPADPEIALYDAKGNLMNIDDDSRGRDGWIVRELTAGEYVIAVRDVDERGGPAFGYRLFLAPPQPRLSARVLPDSPNIARGASVTLNVHIDREHWDDEVTVTLEASPGLAAAPVTIPKGKQDAALVLTARADAPLGPVLLRVIATANRPALRALARTEETYNIQGTAFQRELVGPIAFLVAK